MAGRLGKHESGPVNPVLIQRTSTSSTNVNSMPSSSTHLPRATRVCQPAVLTEIAEAASSIDKHGLAKLSADSPLEALVLHCSVLPGLGYSDSAPFAHVFFLFD